jgi:DNA-binding transcriptional LysR family regulator
VPPRLIGVAWHRDRRRTPAADAFVELALQHASDVDVAAA